MISDTFLKEDDAYIYLPQLFLLLAELKFSPYPYSWKMVPALYLVDLPCHRLLVYYAMQFVLRQSFLS